MLNATRAVALIAVVALGGSLALTVAPLQSEPEPLVPGAETTAAQMEDVVHLTGEEISGFTIGSERTGEPGGVIRDTGGTGTLELTAMTDSRLNGVGTYTMDSEYILGPTGSLMNFVTTSLIENEGGAWRGQGTGSLWTGLGDARGESSALATVWLTGEGAYEGLGGYLILTGMGDDTTEVEGWIFPSGTPPFE